MLLDDYERICQQIEESEPILASKEDELEDVISQVNQKTQELQELNNITQESDSKYKKLSKITGKPLTKY